MNPAFNSNRIENIESTATDHMTVNGAIAKTTLLTAICGGSALVAWQFAASLGTGGLLGSVLLGFIIAMVTIFNPKISPFTSPVYAVLEGIALGIISAMYATTNQGIVTQAILITFGILAAMLGLYISRIIVVTDKLRSLVIAATGGILLLYIVEFILRLCGVHVPYLHATGWLGIGIQLVIIGVAAFNFLLDFDLIEQAADSKAPKYYEWYCGFGILITLVWLYLEVLRLLRRE